MGSHVDAVTRWFGVLAEEREGRAMVDGVDVPGAGEILLITGASGSGKTTLLRSLQRESIQTDHHVIDLSAIVLPDQPAIDVPGLALEESLRLLSLVGLAEAHTYPLHPQCLSEGQAWRLKLASALAQGSRDRRPTLIVADEFAALLDRVTAMALSRALRRASRHPHYAHLRFALATSHDDLSPALAPDTTIRCDFGTWTIQKNAPPPSSPV